MDLLKFVKDNPMPFAELLGIEVTAATPDEVVAEMPVRPKLCTRPDILHGGAVMAFADTLGAIATVANLEQGQGTTTLESKTNFLRALPVGTKVRGVCTPVHKGRRTMVWTTRIYTEDDKLAAQVTQTQMVL
jgi:uncharacterized protein (TIGR00369 family)